LRAINRNAGVDTIPSLGAIKLRKNHVPIREEKLRAKGGVGVHYLRVTESVMEMKELEDGGYTEGGGQKLNIKRLFQRPEGKSNLYLPGQSGRSMTLVR